MKTALGVCPALLALALSGCESEPTPLGPTPLDEGIVVYMHAGFQGPSQGMAADVPDLDRVEGPCAEGTDPPRLTWNDCISSVRVLPGWRATLYGDRDYRGATLEITSDVPDLKAISGSCSSST